MLIIAFSGKQFSGKDTAAISLLNEYGFERLSIAGILKEELASEKNITLEELEANKHIYRPELIALGKKKKEEGGQEVLVKEIIRKAKELNIERLVLTDVRLKQEKAFIEKEGGKLIRIEANKEQRAIRGIIVNENDITETDLDNEKDWFNVIENNMTIGMLHVKIRHFIDLFLAVFADKKPKKCR